LPLFWRPNGLPGPEVK